jgi:hypothetical protein
MISWSGAVVLMFAAIVPTTPVKTLVAGPIAVSMNPVAMVIARQAGADIDPASNPAADQSLTGWPPIIGRLVDRYPANCRGLTGHDDELQLAG